jgi:hypothetical protein
MPGGPGGFSWCGLDLFFLSITKQVLISNGLCFYPTNMYVCMYGSITPFFSLRALSRSELITQRISQKKVLIQTGPDPRSPFLAHGKVDIPTETDLHIGQ